MKKAGVILILLSYLQAYFLKNTINELAVRYIFCFCFFSGFTLFANSEFKSENDKKTKYLFWNVLRIMGVSILLTYMIDIFLDNLIGTTKIIWAIISSTFISLCVYFFRK